MQMHKAYLCTGLLCVNKDGCVNSPRVMVKVKADDACKAMTWWLTQSDYSINDELMRTVTTLQLWKTRVQRPGS